MNIFDFTHAYQPFEPPEFLPYWVLQNLTEIFLPLSRAMKKGVIKRHVQVQGWTIDAWLKCPDPIRSKTQEFLENLVQAKENGFIEIGFSAYSHPILPLLSDNLVKRQINLDYQTVKKYLGEPSWFILPEMAIDKRVLQIFLSEYPNTPAVFADRNIGQPNSSGFLVNNNGAKIVIFNSIFGHVFINSLKYETKPKFAPQNLDWETAKKIVFEKDALLKSLATFFKNNTAILVRDLENVGSKYGLFEFEKGVKDIKSFIEAKEELNFKLLKDSQKNNKTLDYSTIVPSTWDYESNKNNPYPYWNLPSWINFVNAFNEIYNDNFDKETLIILASDVPWHILAKKEFDIKNPEHSKQFTQKVIFPIVKKIGDKNLIEAAQNLSEDLEKYN